MRTIAAALLALACISSRSDAVVVEIPVPSLAGHYPVVLPNVEWPSAIVQLPGIPSQIHSVSLRIRGTTEVGVLRCEDVVGPWPTATSAYFGKALPQVWWAGAVTDTVAGQFEQTSVFTPYNGQTTWDLFLDGTERLYLQAGATGYLLICSPLTPEPTLDIDEVTVIVDAEFAVPAATSTWGRLKSTYR